MSDGQPGIGVDAQGGAVIDPTKNVLDLVESAIKRQDDLREKEAHHQDVVRMMEAKHTREIGNLRAHFYEELRKAEAARIDAIRAVDVGNVQRAAEVQATQASTLANQVATSAETLRTQVAATAAQGTLALSAALDPIQKDIADLRRAQYEAQGQKTQVVEARAGSGAILAYVVGAVGILSAIAAVAISLAQ